MKTKLTLLLLTLSVSTMLAQNSSRVASTPKINYDWREGFVSITELTYGTGLGAVTVPLSEYYYGITTTAGYQFTRNMKAGAGVGIHKHNEGTLFPVFVDARFSLNAQRFVPYLDAVGGLALNLNDVAARTWLFINPLVGVRYVAANRVGATLAVGIMTMSGEGRRNTFMNVKLGVEFKSRKPGM